MVGDAAQVQQVIMNLVINASDALGKEGGFIRIATRLEELDATHLAEAFSGQDMVPGSYLVMEVEDNGHGMDAATLARIFDPFFTTKFAGRGLGLAAMLGIVRAHKGGIQVESEPGRGTTFRVFFPASAVPRTERPAPAEPKPFQGAGRVLVVDDEPDIRTSATAMLEWMGFEVLQAADGHAALDLVKAHLGDLKLVVLDFTMPRMDGAACFSAIQGLDPHLPVLLTSGFSQRDSADAMLEAGLAGFLQKPYTLAMLSAKVQEILR
jgi:CheY-like chemotaxis protein